MNSQTIIKYFANGLFPELLHLFKQTPYTTYSKENALLQHADVIGDFITNPITTLPSTALVETSSVMVEQRELALARI